MDYDFSFFLFAASVVTGIIWGGYILLLRSKGKPYDPTNEPLLVEYAHSFFPIVLLVFVLRSFIAEPFRIPSASMMPTLLIGDFILVNKYTYGIRLPVINKKIVALGEPERGDIVVFRFPKEPSVDYIKRVIGLPGDKVTYHDKKLYINDLPVDQISMGSYLGRGQGEEMTGSEQLLEDLGDVEHSILVRRESPSFDGAYIVPKDNYFVMGDNRDNSNDSRFWGTVPEENLVGKAFLIWMNWDWAYKGIGFDRIGTLLK